jgi:surfeit locus 1 family protein
LFVALAVILAAVCARLGFWQISRLHQRRAYNALVRSRLDSAEVDISALPRDSTARFRRVRVTGTPDYDHELIWAARIHNGSPGVNFLTPYRIPGRDSAVLVDRGWVYAPDGATVDTARWRDTATTLTGFVELFPDAKGGTFSTRPNVISRLSYDVVARQLPYPLARRYVAMIGDSVMAPDRIARLTLPALDEGPHFSYAIQWFSFALVALIGAGYVVSQSRQ